jgi:hypothetical protein
MPLAEDTELVALGVCHGNPRLVTLAKYLFPLQGHPRV